MTRAIWFDLDGTLVTYDRPFDAMLREACGAVGAPFRPAMAEYYTATFFEYFEGFAPDPYEAAASDLVARFDLDCDPAALRDARIDAEVAASVVTDDTRTVVDRLAPVHPVGVLTNGVTAVQRRKLAHHGLEDRFDAVVTSYDAGAHKPDAAVFAAAHETLPADGRVYIADDLESDIVPAREAGFETVHVRNDETAPDASVGDFETVRSLLTLGYPS